jgi:hypothetical protein
MKGTQDWLSILKLRASYGVNGNNNISAYQAYGVYATAAYNGANSTLPSSPDNANLSWEKNYTWNVGLDLGFFDSRINFQIDAYDRITKGMPLTASGWPCFFGGKKVNGKWQWVSSGKTIDYGKWFNQRHVTGDYLVLQGKRWKPVSDKSASAIFVCEWKESEYAKRNEHLRSGKKLPLEAARFTIGNKRYILFDTIMAWYPARRFCELLGGRLACPETPEMQKQIIEKLSAYKNQHILLGGYAKFHKWFWLSGKEITFPLEMNKDMSIPTLNRNFVTLYDGKFYNSQYSRSFLCEWDDSI